MVFVVPKDRMVFATASEGGVWHDSDSRCGEAAFPYVPEFAVVISWYSALIGSGGGKRE